MPRPAESHSFPVIGEWRSLVAHLLWEQGVAGSNPVSPTICLVLYCCPGVILERDGK